MRKTILGAVLLVLLSTTAFAGPKEEAFQVLEQWTKAFNASDVDAIVKLHASDALFLGTIYYCINNATCVLLIRPQITSYLLGISLDAAKRGSQCRAQFVLGCEIAIVGAM